mmetsp:Transcript_3516/g.12402  ORF Transcript_3516/g.12402 Transcript_3516/m.12402 type:complete len:322 (-) Transcript_3516:1319-2284(-)
MGEGRVGHLNELEPVEDDGAVEEIELCGDGQAGECLAHVDLCLLQFPDPHLAVVVVCRDRVLGQGPVGEEVLLHHRLRRPHVREREVSRHRGLVVEDRLLHSARVLQARLLRHHVQRRPGVDGAAHAKVLAPLLVAEEAWVALAEVVLDAGPVLLSVAQEEGVDVGERNVAEGNVAGASAQALHGPAHVLLHAVDDHARHSVAEEENAMHAGLLRHEGPHAADVAHVDAMHVQHGRHVELLHHGEEAFLREGAEGVEIADVIAVLQEELARRKVLGEGRNPLFVQDPRRGSRALLQLLLLRVAPAPAREAVRRERRLRSPN